MSEKNLPIKLVLQKAADTQPNKGGGTTKFFGEVTPALQEEIVEKFDDILTFYEDVFQESDLIPAVGKITVKPEAIAKSHKPNKQYRRKSRQIELCVHFFAKTMFGSVGTTSFYAVV